MHICMRAWAHTQTLIPRSIVWNKWIFCNTLHAVLQVHVTTMCVVEFVIYSHVEWLLYAVLFFCRFSYCLK